MKYIRGFKYFFLEDKNIFCMIYLRGGGTLLHGIKWIGENSFRVMAIHNPVKGFVVVAVAHLFHCSKEIVENSYLYSGISFVVTLVVTVIAVIVIRKLVNLAHRQAHK